VEIGDLTLATMRSGTLSKAGLKYRCVTFFEIHFTKSSCHILSFCQIYFTRNGKMIGKKEVRIPNGGFYPTVGMMSSDEKVRVDLKPLSG
jgi:hypothetical protein